MGTDGAEEAVPPTISGTALSQEPTRSGWRPGSTISSLSQLIAGGTAGFTTVMLLHPLDTLKTRLQSLRITPQSLGPSQTFHQILSVEGISALYRGAMPALVASAVSWGLYFQSFSAAHVLLSPYIPHSTGAHLTSATIAGVTTILATNPIWVVKVRLQLQTNFNAHRRANYKGLCNALTSIVREEGVRGLYSGIGPSLWLVSHGAVQFTLYERFKQALKMRQLASSSADAQHTSVEHSLIASTASKVVASVATYPLQVVRTRMQERDANRLHYGRFVTALAHIAKSEGRRGLYRGLSANLIRVTPQSAITFATYEQVLRLCAGGGKGRATE